MGVTLTGKAIKDTYEGLLKFTDNNPVTVSYKEVTDGFGNSTGLSVSTTGVQAGELYNTQTTSQITNDGSDFVVPNRGWVLANLAASTSFASLSDTFGSLSGYANSALHVNSSGTAIEPRFSHYDFACGDETSDIGVGNVSNIEFPYLLAAVGKIDFTVTSAPTGSNLIIDVLLNGSSVFVGSNKPTIDAGSTSTLNGSVSSVITGGTFNINEGDVLSVNVTQVGSSNKGVALKCFLTYNYSVSI